MRSSFTTHQRTSPAKVHKSLDSRALSNDSGYFSIFCMFQRVAVISNLRFGTLVKNHLSQLGSVTVISFSFDICVPYSRLMNYLLNIGPLGNLEQLIPTPPPPPSLLHKILFKYMRSQSCEQMGNHCCI